MVVIAIIHLLRDANINRFLDLFNKQKVRTAIFENEKNSSKSIKKSV